MNRLDGGAARCPLCRGRSYAARYDLRHNAKPLAVPGVVARCRACGMWFKIVADGTRVADAYGDHYAEAGEVADRYRLGDATRRLFRGVLERLEVTAGGASRPRLLDIGTGLGAMLEEAAARGFDAEGVELCAPLAARARARGLRVENVAAETLADRGRRYHAITLMDVIEHLPDPLAVLATVRRLLRPGGELVVYTPNHRSAVVLVARALARLGAAGPRREIFGGNHLCFFDHRTLPAALARAGFRTRALDLARYDPRRPGQPVSALALLAVSAIERLGQPWGRVFRMTAYARPVDA